MVNVKLKVTGYSLPEAEFVIPSVDKKPSEHIRKVLLGQALGLHVKGYLSPRESEVISANFSENAGIHPRTDAVSGVTVGVDLFGSDAADYLREVRAERSNVESLFYGAVNVPGMLREDIQRYLTDETAIRPAAFNGQEFNYCRAVGWTDTGKYALKPHDDLAQLKDPRQACLETSLIDNTVALNVYPSVTEEGGELVLYNCAPDEESKRRLGIEYSGYSYPEECLEGYEKIVLRPEAGDLVIIAGKFVHGVTGAKGNGFRLLLNHFAGHIDDKTIVMWS